MTKNNTTKRKRTSKIWILPDNEFALLIKQSRRIKDVLNFFGVCSKGGNFRTAKERIEYLHLDTSHFAKRIESSLISRTTSLEDFKSNWLIDGSKKSRGCIKRNILKYNLLKWECSECGNNGTWYGKKLILHLEHKNGVSNDNRLENLCFLCPNCHSQTKTYAGKNCRART